MVDFSNEAGTPCHLVTTPSDTKRLILYLQRTEHTGEGRTSRGHNTPGLSQVSALSLLIYKEQARNTKREVERAR